MANLIQNNSKLIEQQKNQISTPSSTTAIMQNNKRDQSSDANRKPKTIRIIKDQSGFGFNVRGQISGESCNISSDLLCRYFSIPSFRTKRKYSNELWRVCCSVLKHPLESTLVQWTGESGWLEVATLTKAYEIKKWPFLLHNSLFSSWWSTEINKWRALCSFTTCVSDSRERISGAGWNKKGR